MLASSNLERVLVIAPHGDDEVLGCGDLMAKLTAQRDCRLKVLYVAVAGSNHYGLSQHATYQQRLAEINSVADLLRFSYDICFGDKNLLERLDTLPKRQLVDLFEVAFNDYRPELLLLPWGSDYDQDHVAVFQTAIAAARPIGKQFGKWLIPHVLTYELTKLNWGEAQQCRPVAYCDISDFLSTKLEALRCYASQLRPSPHVRCLESITALATIRGKEVGVEYAEAFGVLRTAL